MSNDAPHHLDVAIGRRIRDRRRAAGVSQGQLARSIGVTFQQVQKYERGANRVSFSRLMEIVAALGCQLSDLAEGLGSEPSADQVDRARQLISETGATELLQAYAQLSSPSLRQALIQHAQALVGVAKAETEA
jgi:transcriptional regulator with XRE-family HTH domain